MEDTELRNYFANMDKQFARVDKRFSELEVFIKGQIEGLAIITGRSFALMHQRFDEIDERFEKVDERFAALEGRTGNIEHIILTKMLTKDDLALLEVRVRGEEAE